MQREHLQVGTFITINQHYQYKIERCLNEGGNALIYEATSIEQGRGRRTIIKEFFPYDLSYREDGRVISAPGSADQFQRLRSHMKTESQLSGEAANTTYHVLYAEQVDAEQGYMVMAQNSADMISFASILDQWEKKAPDSPDPFFSSLGRVRYALKMISSALSGLRSIHQDAHILHGDISPTNLFWAGQDMESGLHCESFFLDFGSAVKMDQKDQAVIFNQEHFTGFTSGFGAPEREYPLFPLILKPSSDLFSMSVLLALLCCGKQLCHWGKNEWHPLNLVEFHNKHVKRAVKKLSLPPAVKNTLLDLLMKGLAKDPEMRFQTAQAMQEAVEALISECEIEPHHLTCHVPDPVGHFYGRGDEISQLKSMIDDNVQMIFITGAGGIGKSELGLQFAKELRNEFTAYRTYYHENLEQTIADLPFEPSPPVDAGTNLYGVKMRCLQHLDEHSILIIDNCDIAPDILKSSKAYQELCQLKLRIMFTTRYEYPDNHSVSVGHLEMDSLIRLVRRFYQCSCDYKILYDLIETVQFHTLTVELLAKILQKSHGQISPEEMLGFLKTEDYNEISWPAVGGTYHDDFHMKQILGHLMTVFNVAGLNREARQILLFASLLPIDGIESTWFQKTFSSDYQNLIHSDLISGGWLQYKEGIISLHPLICTVCHALLQQDHEDIGFHVVDFVKAYEISKNYSQEGRNIVLFITDRFLYFISQQECEEFLCILQNSSVIFQHACYWNVGNMLLSMKDEEARSIFSGNSPKWRKLYDELKMDKVCQARQCFSMAIHIAKQNWPENDPDLAKQCQLAGNWLCNSDHSNSAEVQNEGIVYLEDAFSIYRRRADKNSYYEELIKTAYCLSRAYLQQGYKDKSLSCLLETLRTYEKSLDGINTSNLADLYQVIGYNYADLNDHIQALLFLNKAVQTYSRTHGEQNHALFLCYYMQKKGFLFLNMALSLRSTWGTNQEGILWLDAALQDSNREENPDHAMLFLVHSLLVEAYSICHDIYPDCKFCSREDAFQHGRKHMEAVLDICRKYLPEDHALLAEQYRKAFRYADAEKAKEYAARLLDIYRCQYSEEKLAEKLIETSRRVPIEQQIQYLNTALDIYERLLPENDIRRVNLYEELGYIVSEKQGRIRIQQALSLYEKYQEKLILPNEPGYKAIHAGRECQWQEYFPLSDRMLGEKYFNAAQPVYFGSPSKKRLFDAEKAIDCFKNANLTLDDWRMQSAYQRYIEHCGALKQCTRMELLIDEYMSECSDLLGRADFAKSVCKAYKQKKRYEAAEHYAQLASLSYEQLMEQDDIYKSNKYICQELYDSYINLAYIYAHMGYETEVCLSIEKVRQLEKNFPAKISVRPEDRLCPLGLVYANMGKYRKCKEYYRRMGSSSVFFRGLLMFMCVTGPWRCRKYRRKR